MSHPTPQPGTSRQFLDAAFGHIEEPGLIEIAYSGTDGGAITRARLFENTPAGRGEAADFAASVNATPGVNCYFAPSLRKLDADRGKRAKKVNVLGSPMVWADFDEPGSPDAGKAIYTAKGFAPHLVVVTGQTPYMRAQAFWLLDGLVHDQRELDEMLAGVHVGLDFVADPKVVNADRVMRLPGSVSWPKPGKEGRIAEGTILAIPKSAPQAPHKLADVTAIFPRKDPVPARKGENVDPGAGDLLSAPQATSLESGAIKPAPLNTAPPTQLPSAPAQASPTTFAGREPIFDMLGRRIEGRDEYAMNVIGGAIRNLAARLGRWPDAQAIYNDAWPTFERHCAPKKGVPGEPVRDGLEREGRGPTWFAQKCQTHAERARTGAIIGMETIEKAVASAQAHAATLVQNPQTGTPGAGSVNTAVGAGLFPPKISRPKSFAIRDFSTIPRRRFLYGKHYIRQFVSATISPGGVGKSSLALVEAVAMCTGRPLLGVPVPVPLRVWNWNLEDPIEESERRVAAILQEYRLTTDQLGGRLFLASGRDEQLVLATATRDGTLLNEELVEQMIEFARDEKIDVISIDPFVSSHEVNENDNNAIDKVVKSLGYIAARADCAIEIVHHSRKAPSGERDAITTDDDARGAGAIKGAARAMRTLNRMTQGEAEKFGIEKRFVRSYVRIDDGKQNLAPPADKATWFQLVGQSLPNGDDDEPGDNVGVVKPWNPPSAFDGVTTAHASAVQAACVEAEHNGLAYRTSAQSAQWIGHLVGEIVGFDTTGDEGRARAGRIVKEWLANEVLRQLDGYDEHRKPRPCVTAGGKF